MSRPYLIVAPGFAHQSGGIKVLHRLCHLLNQRGFTAYITGAKAPLHYEGYCNTRSINELSKEELSYLQNRGIVVYPDIIPGNPLCFTTVVRWFVGLTCKAPPFEMVFSYSEHLRVHGSAENNLMIWHIEDFFQEPATENRTIKCFRVGKGTSIPKVPETEDAIEITNFYPPRREELARLFQCSEVFYSYDECTILNSEARLCGCPVVVLGYTNIPEDFYKGDPFTLK